ncbi:glycoside hydrolase family 25 protein [Mycolicibacterium palauense]|uniref:glycoside hydrolase family 25 protein n=1 Tax=Mycolicibacterium palauense TaxID=2034511 RepID=UPI000BFEE4C9|nr:GH25 family lysozyme [Mycolicibacterium palauense]
MSVTRADVEYLKARFRERVGNVYVYAGIWSKTNIRQGCDCSALAAHALNGVLYGVRMQWQRVDPASGNWITTESWRPIDVGQRGPFGTITVAHPNDFPSDAVVKIALHHGPGGGANSHMWLEVDGVRMESHGRTTKYPNGACVTGDEARSVYDTSYANDWAYLPGPIVEDGTAIPDDPNAVTYGIDISNHQGVMDLDQVKAEGFDFVWAKVSEGASYRDPYWPRTRDDAQRLGLILAGYHYIRDGDPAAQARLFVDQLGDKTIPAMLDFEAGSGPMSQFWAVKREIEALGVAVRLSYIPDWYWEKIGRPDLSQVPGLIRSEYVSGAGYASVLYPGNSSSLWGAYGGRTPDILQFADKALVAGKLVDANAFRGTTDQLRALLDLTTGDDELSGVNIDRLNRAVDKILGGNTMPGDWLSRGMFAPADDTAGGVDDTVGMLLNTDGNAWNIVMIIGALLGVERDVQAVRDNAAGRFPEGSYVAGRPWLRARAQEFAQKLLPLCGLLNAAALSGGQEPTNVE